jgi:predicted permease
MYSWSRRLRLRLKALLFSRRERELHDELQSHLDFLEDEYREKGMDPAEARIAARRQFGNATALKERSRDQFTFQRLDDLWRDIRFGIHSLLRTPSFTLGAVATLALGIGFSVAAFSLVYGVAFAPLPFSNPDELVSVDVVGDGTSFIGASLETFEDVSFARSLAGVAGWRGVIASRDDDGPPDTLSVEQVIGPYFETLGIRPAAGSVFTTSGLTDNGTLPAVISHDYWQEAWGGSPSVLGSTFRLKGLPGPGDKVLTVIGVLPPNATGPKPFGSEDTSVWTPGSFGDRFQIFARLRSGETISAARAEMAVFSERLNFSNGVRLGITPASAAVMSNSWPILIVFSLAVGCVFLIAVLNLTNLQAARVLKRARELSVRASLGASRWRLARQMIVESMLLTLTGAVLGFLVAYALRDIAIASIPSQNIQVVPRLETVAIDLRAFTFAVVVGLGAGVVIGLVPAFRASRENLDAALKNGSSKVIEHRSQHRLQQVLIGVETMVAVVLLVVAGLFLEDFRNLVKFDPGFSADHVVAAEINLPRRYADDVSRELFFKDVVERVRSLGAVEAVSVSSEFPKIASSNRIAAQDTQAESDAVIADVTPDYLQVFQLRMLSGRWITGNDLLGKDPVVVLSARIAQDLFPGLNPIGKRVRTTRAGGKTFTVVGVVGDVRFSANQDRYGLSSGHVYTSYLGRRTSIALDERMTVAARVSQSGTVKLADILKQAEPHALIKEVSADEAIAPWIIVERFFATVLSFCSIAAFGLAMMGIYSLVTYSTGERSREIGLRVALGGTPMEIVLEMMRRGAVPAAVGLVVGAGLSQAAIRLVGTSLMSAKPGENLSFTLVLSFAAIFAGAASWIPAWRASRVDPIIALRHE